MIDFGEVRSILHGGEEAQRWSKLCELCGGATQAEWDEQLSPYVMPVVSRWPDAERKMPPLWLRRALEGGELPACLPMAASVKLALTTQSMTGQFDLRRLERLATPALRALSLGAARLDLRRYGDKLDVSGLLGSSALTGLRELELGGELASEGVVRRLASNEALRDVALLGLADVKIDRRLIDALEQLPSARAGQLRGVRLTRCEGVNPALGGSDLWRGVTSLAFVDEPYSGDFNHEFSTHINNTKLETLTLDKARQGAVHIKLVGSDACESLERFKIHDTYIIDIENIIDQLGRWRLRGLSWRGDALEEEQQRRLGRLVAGGEAFERLEVMELGRRGSAALEAARGAALPALRVLRLGLATRAQLSSLAACHMPALRSLTLRLSKEDGDERDALAALLDAPWWPQLTQLCVLCESDVYALRAWLEPRWDRAGLSIRYGFSDHASPLWDDLGAALV